MPTSRILMGLLPIGLLLSACASQPDRSTQTVPTDSTGKKSIFTDGFAALQRGDNLKARHDLEESYRANPTDPYEEENLAAAYQNTSELGKALPLYRDVIAKGDEYQTMFTTRPEVAGMSIADIARWNLKLAGVDEYGNVLQPSQAAALQSPSSQYEVYFDFNRADLTAEGEAIVRAAAKSVLSGNLARIAVVGHTDTVGSDGYNQKLSERRASAVEHALVADGVPGDTIAASGVGKHDLMLPTPDGVREPKNRRVEITAQEAQTD